MAYDKNWLLNTDDNLIIATQFWRGYADRLAADALMVADSSRSYATAAHNRLLFHVARAPDADALAAYRRQIVLMAAFAGLQTVERELLEGRLQPVETAFMTGNQAHALMIERRRQVQNSHPAMADYFAGIHEEAERAASAQRQQEAAHKAGVDEAARDWAAAPGIVLDLHKRGFRLEVRDNRVAIFPASKLTDEDRAVLASKGASIIAAIQAEWTA